MYQVDLYRRVRVAVTLDGMSIREAARQFNLHRETVRKMLAFSAPPGYQQSKARKRPVLDPFTGVIDEILRSDLEVPRKQRHTAHRIFERLRDEHGYPGCESVVRDYVSRHRPREREVFIPLEHKPGSSQGDFGQALARIGGQLRKIFFFVFDLPHSGAFFCKAYPAETTEAIQDGFVSGFEFFGGVPEDCLLDNTKLAVAQILSNGERVLAERYVQLVSHYVFKPRFGRPGRGNDKGSVEGLVRFARQNALVPVPEARDFAELNARLEQFCRDRLARRQRGHRETCGERLQRDLEAFHPLPSTRFEACHVETSTVRSVSLVRYKTNDYSVPTDFAYRDVVVKGFVGEVVISCGAEEIARHRRCYGRQEVIYEPRHYLKALERKPGALDQAAPLSGWELPKELQELRRQLEGRFGNRGRIEFIQVLRLLETFEMDLVRIAAGKALDHRAVSFDAVKHLLLCAIEKRPARLDLSRYPFLPQARVRTTRASSYNALLAGGRP